jgi:hypothetical protein
MKHTRNSSILLASVLLASVLLASVALAQTRDSLKEESISAEDSISAARSQYAQTSNISPDADNAILAQLPRGGPARPFPARRGYPRGTYQTTWMEHGNPGHALIGAGIGIGVGAALGAISNANKGAPVGSGAIVLGALFGFIGGAIGAAHGGPHMFAHRGRVYRPCSPEDDEESQLHSHSKAKEGSLGQSVLAKQASPDRPIAAEAMPPLNSGMPAVP